MILRYKVCDCPTLTSRKIRVVFGGSSIFERLIHIGWPLISHIFSLNLIRSHCLHNVVFVDGYRSHYNRSDRWSLVARKGNLLFSLSFKNLLLFQVIAVNIAILTPLVWVGRSRLRNVMIIVILRPTDLLVVDLLMAVSRKLTWCNNLLLVVLVHADRL